MHPTHLHTRTSTTIHAPIIHMTNSAHLYCAWMQRPGRCQNVAASKGGRVPRFQPAWFRGSFIAAWVVFPVLAQAQWQQLRV